MLLKYRGFNTKMLWFESETSSSVKVKWMSRHYLEMMDLTLIMTDCMVRFQSFLAERTKNEKLQQRIALLEQQAHATPEAAAAGHTAGAGSSAGSSAGAGSAAVWVGFVLKNLHFLLKNLHFPLTNLRFLLKNLRFLLKNLRFH